MDPRGHFIEHRAGVRGEEFERRHPDVIERSGNLGGQRARRFDLRLYFVRSRNPRPIEHAVLVDVFGAVPEQHLPVLPAAQDHAELVRELHQPLIDHRLMPKRNTFGLVIVVDPILAFAVVPIAPGLENPGRSDPDQCCGQIVFGIDRHERRRPPAQLGNELLLGQPVLCNFERAQRGEQRNIAERSQRADRDVLELVSDHRAGRCKLSHCCGIVPRGGGLIGADLARDAVLLRAVNMAAIAELRRRARQHPPELSAAQDTDG